MVYQFIMSKEEKNKIHPGKLPVYLQIAEQISREISAGLLIDGQRLPPERRLARDYGVTVRTLRKSLAQLTKLGLLVRKQGSGNYVRKNENSESIYFFFRLELPQGGGLPSAQMLSVETVEKPAALPRFGTSGFAHRFRRLRFLDDIPVAIEEIWLDRSCAEKINKAQISQSLYKFYKDHLGFWIARAEDWVGVAPLPEWAKGIFPSGKNAAFGFVERFAWSQDESKVEYSRTWYDTGTACYVARLK